MVFNAHRNPDKSSAWDWTNVYREWREEREMSDDEMLVNMMAWATIPAASRN